MGLWPKAGLVTTHMMERPRRVPHLYELLDEIQILNRSACRSLPSLTLPSRAPDGCAVDGILRIRIDMYRPPREGRPGPQNRLQKCREFGSLIRRITAQFSCTIIRRFTDDRAGPVRPCPATVGAFCSVSGACPVTKDRCHPLLRPHCLLCRSLLFLLVSPNDVQILEVLVGEAIVTAIGLLLRRNPP